MSKHPAEKTPSDSEEGEERLKKEFPGRLRRLREDAGKKQSQVAKALGFASETVYQLWEKEGGNLPSALNLRKLAVYFNVSTDYLLGLQDDPHRPSTSGEMQDDQKKAQRKVFRLALQGKNWNAPDVASQLNTLRLSRLESPQDCYERVLTDLTYPPPPRDLPVLSDFYTPAAQAAQKEIEQLFLDRRPDRVRQVTMYVLDLSRVPSMRLQRIILGMQGAELIKRKHAKFTLAIANGRMARDVILAPNLMRGDIQDVEVMPLVLGRSQDTTAATTLIGNFVFNHGDYGVERVYLKDEKGPQRIAMRAGRIDLAFMGIGSVEAGDPKSLFAKLLAERGLDPDKLRAEGVIGNVLYHFIREDPSGPSWEIHPPPEGKNIRVDFDESAGDEILQTVRLGMIEELVEIGGAQMVTVVKDQTRAPVVRAALEMRWANTVICSLTVANELRRLLIESPLT